MEQKLAEFRARRRREELVKKAKDKVYNLVTMNFIRSEMTTQDQEPLIPPRTAETVRRPSPPESLSSDMPSEQFVSSSDEEPEETEEDARGRLLRRANWVLMALLWTTVFLVAIQLQFGFVYLILSGLLFIYMNTKTTPRVAGEPSAYSVFNPNCEAIDGTLNADQFEREIRFGAGSVR